MERLVDGATMKVKLVVYREPSFGKALFLFAQCSLGRDLIFCAVGRRVGIKPL